MEHRTSINSSVSQTRNRRPSGGRSVARRPLNRKYKSDYVAALKRRNTILLGLYAVLAGVLAAAICSSPLLGIHRIKVRGADSLSPEERMAISKAISIVPGTNVLLVPTGKIEKALAKLSYVKGSGVRRASANSLEATLEVREPFLLVRKGNEIFESDSEGVPIRQIKPKKSFTLPVVQLNPSYTVTPGVLMSDDAIQSAIQILKNAHYRQLAGIAKIDIDQNGNLCLNMADGIVFFLGQAKNIQAKMEKVRLIYLKSPHIARRMLSINLSCLENPVCVLRPTPPPKPATA